MKSYTFSIVIPVYNAEKYIGEMIQSILDQSYSDWNLILIDDGSTDNSGVVCDGYACDKIAVIHNTNKGQVAARIDGILRAKGNYTLVLDADDKISPNYLKRANEILNDYEYDVVMFPYEICDDNLNPTGETSVIPNEIGRMTRTDVLTWIIESYNHGLVDKIIKTDLIKKGIQDVPQNKLKVNGDYALLIPIICQINSAFYDAQPMYYYRVLKSSTSHSYVFQHLLDTNFVSNFVEKTLIKYNLYNNTFERLVKVAYLHMICWMTEGIVESSNYHLSDFRKFKELEYYKQSVAFEKRDYLSIREYYELKTLRHFTLFISLNIKTIHILRKLKHK